MAKLLGVDVPAILHGALSSKLYRGSLTSRTPGSRTPGDPTAGTNPTTVTYGFRGFASTFKTHAAVGDLVRGATHTIFIVANSLKDASGAIVEPKVGDKIVLTDDPQLGSKTATIVDGGVDRDPTGATWSCAVKA